MNKEKLELQARIARTKKIQVKVNMPERMRVCNSSEYNIFLKNRGKFFLFNQKNNTSSWFGLKITNPLKYITKLLNIKYTRCFVLF